MSEEEYTVESIAQARVLHKRGSRITWQYYVRWAGYGPEDNTWEPADSFQGGSEHFLEKFWSRVDTGGRDIHDASAFKKGEEFLPTGPPRRSLNKKKSKSALNSDMSPVLSEAEHPNGDSFIEAGPSNNGAIMTDAVSASPFKRKRDLLDMPASPHASQGQAKPNVEIPVKRARVSHPSPRNVTRQVSQKDMSHPISPGGPVILSDVLFTDEEPAYSPMRGGDNELRSLGESSKSRPTDRNGTSAGHSPDAKDSTKLWRPGRESPTSHTLPSHRARVAKPLVKMVDIPIVSRTNGAISTKARLFGASGTGALSSAAPTGSTSVGASLPTTLAPDSRVPAPRRGIQKRKDSLLVFEKGGLKTLKGNYRPEDEKAKEVNGNNEIHEYDEDIDAEGETDPDASVEIGDMRDVDRELTAPSLDDSDDQAGPPTGQELLRVAGLDAADAAALPDFEDDANSSSVVVATQTISQAIKDVAQRSFAIAMDKLLPSVESVNSNDLSNMRKQPTIFGPLGIGSDSVPISVPQEMPLTADYQRPIFPLTLDADATIRIILKDIRPASAIRTPDLDSIVSRCQNLKGPPGKFYKQEHALAVLQTLKTGGSSARVALSPVGESENRHFERFRQRLKEGDLFVAMAGSEILAFCSSENTNVCQRLQVAPILVGIAENVLVSCVSIEDYSAYADAAEKADNVRW